MHGPARPHSKSLLLGLAALVALALGVANAWAEPQKSPGKLVDLMSVDFNAHPELLSAVDRLASTLQMMETPEHGERFTREDGTGAWAPESEGGARYRAICTASLLSTSQVITAGHCLHAKSGHFEQNHFLRRHLYRVVGGRLTRVGYEDYALSGRVNASQGDLRVLELTRQASAGVPLFAQAPASFHYGRGERFQALGFPNRVYGVPYVTVGCHIDAAPTLSVFEGDYGGQDCPLEGGMSGGPQYRTLTGEQIGINSMSGGAADPDATVSPRATLVREGFAANPSAAVEGERIAPGVLSSPVPMARNNSMDAGLRPAN